MFFFVLIFVVRKCVFLFTSVYLLFSSVCLCMCLFFSAALRGEITLIYVKTYLFTADYPRRRRRGGRVSASVCLCVFFSHDISKTDASRITKRDIEMFQDESWKLLPTTLVVQVEYSVCVCVNNDFRT